MKGSLPKSRSQPTEGIQAARCQHFLLSPRWQAPQDMGISSKASRFICESCGRTFSPAVAFRFGWQRRILEWIGALAGRVLATGSRISGPDQDDRLRVNRALIRQQGKVYFVLNSLEQASQSREESGEPSDNESIFPTQPLPGCAIWQSTLSGSQQA